MAEQSANTAPALAEQDVCTPSRRKTEIVSENMSNHTAEFKGGSGTFLMPKRKLQFQQISKGAEKSPTKRRKYNEQLNQKSTVSSCSSQWGPGKDVDQE